MLSNSLLRKTRLLDISDSLPGSRGENEVNPAASSSEEEARTAIDV